MNSDNSVRFSVVIVTCNRLKFLKRAIDSVFAQTAPCEAIVVDNSSNDGTEDYCKSLAGRIIYLRNQSNLGHSAGIKLGVEIASGNWIKPLDDDDYLTPNCLEEISSAIAKHPEAVICSVQAAIVNNVCEGIGLSRLPGKQSGDIFYVPQEDIHFGMLFDQLPFGRTSQVAFNKEASVKTHSWEGYPAVEDFFGDEIFSWISIAQSGDAIFINKPLAYYSIWEGSYVRKDGLVGILNRHLQIKERIFSLVSKKHESELPHLKDVKNYLRIFWGLIGLRQLKFVSALKIIFPAAFSIGGWNIFRRILLSQSGRLINPRIRRIILPG